MYRFIDFNDEKIDSLLLMELADLSKTLLKDPEYAIEFRVHSYINEEEKKLYISHFWNHRDVSTISSGMKSDVFLRAFGNKFFTNDQAVQDYLLFCNKCQIPRFAKQLFALAEDLRIEERCKKARPGMKKEFKIRRHVYLQHFTTQLKVNLEKSFFTDALFNLTYLLLNAQTPFVQMPHIQDEINPLLPLYRTEVERFFDADNTGEIAEICQRITHLTEHYMKKDMINEYFHLASLQFTKQGLDDDLSRKDPLINDDGLDDYSTGDEEIFDEEMKTWHRETSSPGNTFLQFDLDQGTQTDILADGAREGEAGDQASAIVQGSTRKSTNKDFSELDMVADVRENEGGQTDTPYGKENQQAEPIFITALEPTEQQIIQYKQYKTNVLLHQKKLKKMIQLVLEHKKILPRSDLQFGRLNRKLVRFFTDEQPRIFYKKNEESQEIDAVFSLLIDCSASMEDKMDETKSGIALFHEALKSVQVPHEITGFWEDANDATPIYQPNYFKRIIDFSASLKRQTGPEIMQLDAEEDNRDGFAIRMMAERLLRRTEKQKFLIIFSDGEPAAFGYDQNGIIDTHEAVVDARKKGIEVFNIFLSQHGVAEEQRKVFQNIYGPYSLIAPTVDILPELLLPLLKKLLLKSINQ